MAEVPLHGCPTGPGLRLMEPHSELPVDVLDEPVEEDDPVLLSVLGGVVLLAAEDRYEPGSGDGLRRGA